METADGVSGAAADSVWPQRLQPRPRCPRCGAWVSAVGRCKNPECPKQGEEVVDMAKRHILARCQTDNLGDATAAYVEHAAYQMSYEGLPVADREHNPFEEGDGRYTVFNEAVLKGKEDLEADAEVVRVIMEGPDGSATPSEQEGSEEGDEGPTVTLADVRSAVGRGWRVSTYDNWEPPENDPHAEWDEALRAGRDYMVGSDVPLDEYVKRYRSPMRRWQQVAYEWARKHPNRMLIVVNASNSWEVYKRGDYVELGLPHHDAGGERHYISRDGKTKVRVNQD